MTARIRMTPGERHLRPGGTVSGPTLFTLADCAVYLCLIAMVGPEALAVTTNASIDFMRKPEAGKALIAEVTLLKLGRALVVGDVRMMSDGSGALVAGKRSNSLTTRGASHPSRQRGRDRPARVRPAPPPG